MEDSYVLGVYPMSWIRYGDMDVKHTTSPYNIGDIFFNIGSMLTLFLIIIIKT